MRRLAALTAHEMRSTVGGETVDLGGGPHHAWGCRPCPATREALRLTTLKPAVRRPIQVTARVHAAAIARARSRRSSRRNLATVPIGDLNQPALVELGQQ